MINSSSQKQKMTTPGAIEPVRSDLDNIQIQLNQKQNEVIKFFFFFKLFIKNERD
jgi:hypothetical protein